MQRCRDNSRAGTRAWDRVDGSCSHNLGLASDRPERGDVILFDSYRGHTALCNYTNLTATVRQPEGRLQLWLCRFYNVHKIITK